MAITLHTYHTEYNPFKSEQVIKTFAEGAVLAKGSRSCRVMSDVWDTEAYALYWDEESQSVKSVGLYLHCESPAWESKSHAEVDATPAVWKKVQKYYEEQEYRSLESDALKQAKQIAKDSVVKVTAGRQNKGTEGKVVAIIQRAYGMGYRSSIENKLGIATSEEKIQKQVGNRVYDNYKDVVWVWARNCELVNVPQIDIKQVRANAQARAKSKVEGLKSGRGY